VGLFLTVGRLLSGRGDMNAALDTLLYFMEKELGVARAMVSLYHGDSGKVFLERSLGFTESEAGQVSGEIFRGSREPQAAARGLGRHGAAAQAARCAGPPLPLYGLADGGSGRGLVSVPIARGDRLLGAMTAQPGRGGQGGAKALAARLSEMAGLFSGEAGLYMAETIDRAARDRRLRALALELYELKERSRPSSLVSSSPAMQEVYFLLRKVASRKTVVLIKGERGVEKETVAQSVHYEGLMAGGPFVKYDCASAPPGEAEAALFGRLRREPPPRLREGRRAPGAPGDEGQGGTAGDRPATGSGDPGATALPGLVEAAEGGTLFIDSVELLPLSAQAALLQVLKDRAFEKIPGEGAVPADVRLVAGTSADLKGLSSSGAFLEELFYRLDVFPITIPPLREREEDIVRLSRHFLARHAGEGKKPARHLSQAAMECLRAYSWPGNVDELESAMRLAVAASDGRAGPVEPGDLPATVRAAAGEARLGPQGLEEKLAAVERGMISEALSFRRGNVSRAAGDLGLTRRSMGLRMKRLSINYKDFRT
jgi:Nif-specific regulatory protein